VSRDELKGFERIVKAKIFLFPSESYASREELTNDSEVICGLEYSKIGIQLFNNFEKPMIGLPHVPKDPADRRNTRYSVELNYDGYDFRGSCFELLEYDDQLKVFKKYTGSTPISSQVTNFPTDLTKVFYPFYHVKFNKLGNYDLTITVRLPDKDKTPIFQDKLSVNFIRPPVQSATINFHMEKDHIFTLGDFLPPFTLSFFGINNQPIAYEGEIKIVFESKEMLISKKEKKGNESLIEVNENDHYTVESNTIWKPIPFQGNNADQEEDGENDESIPTGQLFHPEQYISQKSVAFKCLLLEKVPGAGNKNNNKYKALCPEISFQLMFRPGFPFQLDLSKPPLPIQVENNSPIPFLHFILKDLWGNRTVIPSNEGVSGENIEPNEEIKWFIEFSEGPLSLSTTTSSSTTTSPGNMTEIQKGQGELLCSMVKCSYRGSLPTEGKEVNQIVKLKSSNKKLMKDIEIFQLPLLILPDVIPSTLKVIYRLFVVILIIRFPIHLIRSLLEKRK
jgi:hypothetical protein